MDSEERIRQLETEVRRLRIAAEKTQRTTSWMFWLLIGIPAVLFGVVLFVMLFAFVINIFSSS